MTSEMEDSPNPEEVVSYTALPPQQQQQRLTELAIVFLRLGTIAFGGPAAHIALMDQEVVQRRRWMSHEKLLDLLGVTNLIPGPNSTELAIHIGYERAGWRGLLIAGSCFVLPAMLVVWFLAVLYARYQALPQVEWLLYGIKPGIIAIVLQALWKLGRKAIQDLPTGLAGMIAVMAYLASFNEIMTILLLGMAVMGVKQQRRGTTTGAVLLPFSEGFAGVLAQAGNPAIAPSPASASVGWTGVFLFFLKIGCVLYGSGYVLLAFLQRDLVDRYQWLTSQQLLDAVAIGQLTPGPVFTTATFIGYLLAGNAGAIAGTLGIFLPAFLFVWLANPLVSKLRQSRWASGFLDGVNAASLGLMAGVTYTLAQTALVDGLTIGLAILSAIAVFRFKVNSAWIVLAGGAIGWVASLLSNSG